MLYILWHIFQKQVHISGYPDKAIALFCESLGLVMSDSHNMYSAESGALLN